MQSRSVTREQDSCYTIKISKNAYLCGEINRVSVKGGRVLKFSRVTVMPMCPDRQ